MSDFGTKLVKLEELRSAAVGALLLAGLHSESDVFARDPSIESSNGWCEWTRSIRDAQDKICNLESRDPKPTISRKRALRDAEYHLEQLDNAMAALAQELLANALQLAIKAA